MNAFDAGILRALNSLAGRSAAFDFAVVHLESADAVKGAAFMAAFWWLWFSPRDGRPRRRETLFASLVAALAAVFVGRALAFALPFRARPAFDPAFGFVAPLGLDLAAAPLRNWSSFPSDHAMLFAALTAGLWRVSRPIGAAAAIWATLLIGLPRLYCGFHRPTDLLAGAALGVALAVAADAERVRAAVARPVLAWGERNEGPFYAALFLVGGQVATMFDGPRRLLLALAHLLRHR